MLLFTSASQLSSSPLLFSPLHLHLSSAFSSPQSNINLQSVTLMLRFPPFITLFLHFPLCSCFTSSFLTFIFPSLLHAHLPGISYFLSPLLKISSTRDTSIFELLSHVLLLTSLSILFLSHTSRIFSVSMWLYRFVRQCNEAAPCAHISIFGTYGYKLDSG